MPPITPRQAAYALTALLVCLSMPASHGQDSRSATRPALRQPAPEQPVPTVVPSSAPPGGYEVDARGNRRYSNPQSQRQYDAWVRLEQEKRAAQQQIRQTVFTPIPSSTSSTRRLEREPSVSSDRSSARESSGASASGSGDGIQIEMMDSPTPVGSSPAGSRRSAGETSVSLQLR